MSDRPVENRQTMPRPVIIGAGGVILLAAIAGLAFGIARNDRAIHGVDGDTGEIVAPIKGAPSAQAVTAPPVTEADVRRWAREELQVNSAPKPAKKPKVDGDAAADGAEPAGTPAAPASTTTGAAPAVAAAKPTNATANKTAPQIPF